MTFATNTDVADRLGINRDLTAAEAKKYGAALDYAQALLEVSIDKSEDAFDGDIPPALNGICVSIALRIASNPNGLARKTEALGAFSHTDSFQAEGSLALTEQEELLARRAVWGTNSSNGPDDAE